MYVRFASPISEREIAKTKGAYVAYEEKAEGPKLFLYQDRIANVERLFTASGSMFRRRRA